MADRLRLYEEITLLALRDDKGTALTNFVNYLIGAAVLAELLLEGRIEVEEGRRKLVNVISERGMRDVVLDNALERIATAGRRASLQTWVSRMAATRRLRQEVALGLVHKRILRADEQRILLLFTRKVFPELNPIPEREILSRLRRAIFADRVQPDARTVILISLAKSASLLEQLFGRREIRGRKERIAALVSGELTGKATKELIQAAHAAVMVAAAMPAVIS